MECIVHFQYAICCMVVAVYILYIVCCLCCIYYILCINYVAYTIYCVVSLSRNPKNILVANNNLVFHFDFQTISHKLQNPR